ncbi:FAD:protein FMN transferase [Thiosulfatimonas sediminis]|uniref:FAD:protein FMN transferase n=1 Tax=Thiosulfatimonas sediminis TaxID=2675054 RepID=A0A6F8PXI8_9GAMM|nr:FAD:protein FMN transferase [Thiosulfatimonas sediminis]
MLHACSRPANRLLDAYKAQIIVFGTEVDLTLYHPDQAVINQAIATINADFQAFHHEWHAWEKGGIISKINQAIAAGQTIQIADSIRAFIEKSQRLSAASDYLFDPGIGQLIALWGFHGDLWQGPPPSALQISEWLSQRPSIKDITFDDRQQLHCSNRQVQLDFGGNAKGLALDLALQSLQAAKIEHALVSIGGDMKALGNKPQEHAWQVAIQNPQQPQNVIASLPLYGGESVVTSGTYQRFYQWQGQRYSHILNPNTGYPADGFASVTVLHADATTADSAATALLIAGPQNWRRIAQQMGIEMAFCIRHSGTFEQTKAMEKRLKLI